MSKQNEAIQTINLENLVESLEHGPQLKQMLDIFIPLALQLPQLRDNPAMMQETVKTQGESGITDVATNADLHMQEMLMREVSAKHPDWQFWGEENSQNTLTYDESKRFLFIADPIEGTNNFKARNDDLWGSVSALVDVKTKEVLVGIVAHPTKRKFYFAVKGGGVFIADCDQIGKISKISRMSKKPEQPEFTYNNSPHFSPQLLEQTNKFLTLGEVQPNDSTDKLSQSKKTVIIEGDTFVDPESGALEAIKNRGTIYFKTSAEMAAVFVILQELGGKVTDAKGNPWTLGINSLIAARTEEDYEKLKELYNKTI